MKTRTIIHCLSLLFSAAPVMAVSTKPPQKPNIIFILADDLAMGDLGCYGQKSILTPNIDRMAAAGTRFTQAYSGTSVCAPSRTSLMTGLHMGHSPVRGNREIAKGEGQFPLPESTTTVASLLKSSGYATACTGKWGMGMFTTSGSPLKKGFDHFFGYNCQRHAHDYFPTYLYRNDLRFDLAAKTYAQNLIQDDTLAWIREHKQQPFFLFYAVTLPHGQYEIDDLGLYKDKPWTQQEKIYAAMVSRLDSDVGRLLDLLKELALDESTLVMLAGDNGSSFAPESPLAQRFSQAATGLRGHKRTMYEGGLRQAAIARWPGTVPAGRVADEPWAFWDFLPTAVELSNGKLPATLKTDGLSLVSFLKGAAVPQREYFYWELHENKPIQAVRFGDWKAVKNGPAATIELYDLKSDTAEAHNLAADKPDLVARAEQLMQQARTDDSNWSLTARVAPQKKAKAKNKTNP